jgi:neutral ceramidase
VETETAMAADRPGNSTWAAIGRWLPAVAFGALLAVGSSCTLVKIMVKVSFPKPKQKVDVDSYSVVAPAAIGRFRAGVGIADLTPVPGFPTGGYGPAGTVAFGYWTRLHARAFAFQDPDGRALVLVSCELFALPAGLEATVARHASTKYASRGFRLAPEDLIVSATHTHHGPGNYLTSETYNAYGSNYSGFSRELFDFLAARVESAVDHAIESALSDQGSPRIVVHTGRLSDRILRNRSPRTFLLNQTAYSMMNALHSAVADCGGFRLDGEPEDGWRLDGCPRLRAVDSGVTLVEVRGGVDASAPPVGVLVFFASHPTVLEPSSPLYGADFAGVAMVRLEHELAKGGIQPVVGFFNGAEGDITPRRTRRDATDVLELGKLLGDDLSQTLKAAGTPIEGTSVRIRSRRARVHPKDAGQRSCLRTSGKTTDPISGIPTLGTAALGGAEDDRTLLYQLGWKEGVRDRRLREQGPKQPALDSQLVRAVALTESFAPPEMFPASLPITYAELGNLALVAVPFEMSTAQGMDIRSALGAGHGRLEIIGLAGEYSGYVATAAEYDAQDYMAASTIWGPATGALITCTVENLRASTTEAPQPRSVDSETFNAGPKPAEPFGIAFLGGSRARADQELENVLQTSSGGPQHGLPWFVWNEPVRADDEAGSEFSATVNRRVEIRRFSSSDPWDDDRSANLITVVLSPGAQGADAQRRWAAIWIAPLSPNHATGRFYFRVEPPDAAGAGGGAPICSEPFDVANVLPETSPAVPPRSGGCP